MLWLTQNRIGDGGAAHLASSPHFAELAELDLGTNGLSDAGVRAVLASPALRGVRQLQLG